jgi:hypothetical protein
VPSVDKSGIRPMSEEFQMKIELPVDSDGFLRRACPDCDREFKAFASAPGEGEPEPDGGYFCPYCRHNGDDWLTEAQSEYVTAKAGEAVTEELFGGLGGGSGDFVRIEVDRGPGVAELPAEPNDMRRVETPCHPGEPVKVLDGWSGPAYCLICGEPV